MSAIAGAPAISIGTPLVSKLTKSSCPATAGRLKAEGVSSGVPDLFIPAWGLWVEMKRTKGGSLSAEQKDWIAYLESVRFYCIVGKGADDAKGKLQAFFNQHKDNL
jgi:hypothetical protein